MIGKRIIRFDKLDSTNDYVKQHLNALDHGTIIFAYEQSKGKGRFGNVWVSNPGNLYISLLIKNQEYRDNIFDLHIKVSVVLIELLKKYQIEAYIKYPNDIIIGKRKIAGILIETVGYNKARNIILGIGLNVNQVNFLELNEKATSMFIEIGKELKLDEILSDFIDMFNKKSSYLNMYDKYIKKSIIIGRKIGYQGIIYTVKTVEKNGKILLQNSNGETEIDFDKLTLCKEYKNL